MPMVGGILILYSSIGMSVFCCTMCTSYLVSSFMQHLWWLLTAHLTLSWNQQYMNGLHLHTVLSACQCKYSIGFWAGDVLLQAVHVLWGKIVWYWSLTDSRIACKIKFKNCSMTPEICLLFYVSNNLAMYNT